MDLAGWSDEVEQISQQYAERYCVERTSPWFLLGGLLLGLIVGFYELSKAVWRR